MTGVIKKILTDKSFGFIRPDGEREDYFFHRAGCQDWDLLREGQRVIFEPEDSPKGPRARDVEAA